MQKKLLLLMYVIIMMASPSYAVLKEKNIDNTLSLLRLELTSYRTELERQSGIMREQQKQVTTTMLSVMNKSRQNSLMLYSQKNGFIFDLTYACHEATEQYHEFQKNVRPFRQYINTADVENSPQRQATSITSWLTTTMMQRQVLASIWAQQMVEHSQ